MAYARILIASLAFWSAAGQSPDGCSSKEFRAFDFWVGSWGVSSPDGKKLGENRIDSLLQGCVLLENWRDGLGREGKSWNYWHAPSKMWKQHWIDASGRVTEYLGSVTATGIRFEAKEAGVTRVMTFTRRDDGSVEQKIELSRDEGKTWTTGFLGIYRKN